MLTTDPVTMVTQRQQELLAEADHARLVAEVPRPPSGLRQTLAVVCYRLATWLDAPAGYVQMPDPGRDDWATPWASV